MKRFRMKIFIDIILDLIRGLGCVFIISPFILNWFIHGNYERYKWILSGPYPFNSFGSGPFQLWMYIILVFTGMVLFCISIFLKLVRERNIR